MYSKNGFIFQKTLMNLTIFEEDNAITNLPKFYFYYFKKILFHIYRFYKKYQFPGVIGCVDGTHIAIYPPNIGHPVYPENDFVNRKSYHSINTQLVRFLINASDSKTRIKFNLRKFIFKFLSYTKLIKCNKTQIFLKKMF